MDYLSKQNLISGKYFLFIKIFARGKYFWSWKFSGILYFLSVLCRQYFLENNLTGMAFLSLPDFFMGEYFLSLMCKPDCH
jgi:hypothetical protein